MKYILRIKKKFLKCPKLPIKSQVAPVDGTDGVIVRETLGKTGVGQICKEGRVKGLPPPM